MDLSVQVAERQGWTAVLVAGDLDLSTAPKLRQQLQGLVAEGRTHLAVDLDGVAFCDSTGLGVLVGAARRARTAGGDVVLAGLGENLVKVFELTRLDQAFTTYGELDEVPGRER